MWVKDLEKTKELENLNLISFKGQYGWWWHDFSRSSGNLHKLIPQKRELQSKTNSHPQIEKLININFQKLINEDKTLRIFVQASAKILDAPLMETLQINICSEMFPRSFKIANVSLLVESTDS